MCVESDRLDGRPSRKQDQRVPLQRQGSWHERLVVRVCEYLEIVSPLRDHRREQPGWQS